MSHSNEASGTPDHAPAEPGAEAPRAPRRRRTVVVAAAAALVVAAAAVVTVAVVRSGDEPAGDPAPASVPVALSGVDVPDGTTVGVVLTLGDAEGAQWSEAAQGALVAERRLALGGTDVSVVAENDGGTDAGARDAVASLVEQGASGIVVATSGPHAAGAVAAAAEAGVPVVLPYASADDLGTDLGDARSTAPTAVQNGAALAVALGDASSVLLVDAGGGSPQGVEVAQIATVARDADLTASAADIARLTGVVSPTGTGETAPAPVETPADAVVVSGPAARQGAVVAALQAADVSVPLVLTADATSPAFAEALVAAGGSSAGSMVTVGAETDDAVALRSDAAGRSMSAFLGGVRVLAQDGDATNLTGDLPFSAVADAADSRSHDAVLALVRAVSTAGSREGEATRASLSTLELGPGDGVAGPVLDLTRPEALDGEVVPLHASAQSLGLRPAPVDGAAPVVWFAGTTTTTAATDEG
ncbi:hypothetical protein EDF38_1988 [Frigoribacterium sp. PhB160]|uniref:hypothetical protein n=1 Tax=Frigoribacterium sp. PhB160 TaxID=2485192 RepID=UPI000F4A236B|nr:hypothetical protein [Frigoribacterium sp. PhB160]ROS59148.1 hypothetical protein EDF38_1988 [Frigoribacterium sp. PhB160]